MKYRRRIADVEAYNWDGDHAEMFKWVNRVAPHNQTLCWIVDDTGYEELSIHTSIGKVRVARGEWLVSENPWAMKVLSDEAFKAEYERVEELAHPLYQDPKYIEVY